MVGPFRLLLGKKAFGYCLYMPYRGVFVKHPSEEFPTDLTTTAHLDRLGGTSLVCGLFPSSLNPSLTVFSFMTMLQEHHGDAI